MRTLVDIPDSQIEDLAAVCAAKRLSRAEVIRQAITLYVEKNKPSAEIAFGSWKNRGVDGLAYQEGLRSEW